MKYEVNHTRGHTMTATRTVAEHTFKGVTSECDSWGDPYEITRTIRIYTADFYGRGEHTYADVTCTFNHISKGGYSDGNPEHVAALLAEIQEVA